MIFSRSIFLSLLISLGSSTIILKPIFKNEMPSNDLEAGLIFIQGEEINASNYLNFTTQLQVKFPNKLWIAIAQFPSNLPTSDLIGKQINAAFDALSKQGFQITSSTPFFFAGHGLGGILLQDYLLNNLNVIQSKCKIAGLILEGAYVQRKNFAKQIAISNILTIGGELDGLNRITRMTQSFYFNLKNAIPNQITLILLGQNHYQFCGVGVPPALIQQNDIQPEISDSQAIDQTTSVLTSFMKISLNIETESDKNLIALNTVNTLNLVNPLIQAFLMDGDYHINSPCYLDKDNKNCTYGCPWSSTSQQVMGLNSNASIIDVDRFFKATQVFPDPLPEIHNKCKQNDQDCVLNITTISELVYVDNNKGDDESFDPVAATDIKTKLMSRQSVILAATGKKLDFKTTDGDDRCALINNESLKWALSKVPRTTLSRYLKKGKQLEIGSDIDMSNDGPLWLWAPIVNEKFFYL